MTATNILEKKGYYNNEANEIIFHPPNSLDEKVREKFGLEDQHIHLLQAYYIGDADKSELNVIATAQGFPYYDALLSACDDYLVELANEYPDHPQKEDRQADESNYSDNKEYFL